MNAFDFGALCLILTFCLLRHRSSTTMRAPHPASSHRRRAKMALCNCPPLARRILVVLVVLALLSILLHRHLVALFRLLSVYVLWPSLSAPNSLSYSFDSFDTSFARYPVKQWSARWPPPAFEAVNGTTTVVVPVGEGDELLRLANGSYAPLEGGSYSTDYPDVVTPVMHHILLGMPRSSMPESWESSRQSCIDMHPTSANYTHYFWDDASALEFMSSQYPWFLQHWLSYRFPIQRADSLRYFVLHHYGGIFLDLDLQCLRSLGPLRRFPVVNIGAFPVGVSNGFMMAAPRHPFLAQLIGALRAYDRSWFGIPYMEVMFSTGPMFLSAEHLRFPFYARLQSLRVLSEPMHRLNGRVVTPLFKHLGASSWHSDDAKVLKRVKRFVTFHPWLFAASGVAATAAVVWWVRRCCAAKRRRKAAMAAAASASGASTSGGSDRERWDESLSEGSSDDDRRRRASAPRGRSRRGTLRLPIHSASSSSSGSSSPSRASRHHPRRPTYSRYPSYLSASSTSSTASAHRGRNPSPLLDIPWRLIRPLSPSSLPASLRLMWPGERLPGYHEVARDDDGGDLEGGEERGDGEGYALTEAAAAASRKLEEERRRYRDAPAPTNRSSPSSSAATGNAAEEDDEDDGSSTVVGADDGDDAAATPGPPAARAGRFVGHWNAGSLDAGVVGVRVDPPSPRPAPSRS